MTRAAKNPKRYASLEEINQFVDLYLDTPILSAFEDFRKLYYKTYDASLGYEGVSQKTSSTLRKYNALLPKILGDQHERYHEDMAKIDESLKANEVQFNVNYNNPNYRKVRLECRALGKATVLAEIERISSLFLMEGILLNKMEREPVFFSDYQSICGCQF